MSSEAEEIQGRKNDVALRPLRMMDIAAVAGVSRATVSLVMTQSPLVADRTRERVLKVAEDLGYVYNRHAASFRSQRSGIIGLVVSDLRNPFFGEMVATIQRFLAEKDYFVVVVNTLDDIAQQNRALRQLLELRADGVLLVPCPGSDAVEIELISARMPVVLMTRELDCKELSYVGSMDYEGGVAAARHLIESHGCQRLGFFGSTLRGSASEKRHLGFSETARSAGAVVEARWLGDDNVLPLAAYDAFMALLRSGPPPEGLVCNSDNVAFGALRALKDSGYSNVEDCRVIGFDDVEQAAMWSPSLSSVAISRTALGVSGAETVLSAISNELPHPVRIRHESHLRSRESCGCDGDSRQSFSSENRLVD